MIDKLFKFRRRNRAKARPKAAGNGWKLPHLNIARFAPAVLALAGVAAAGRPGTALSFGLHHASPPSTGRRP